MSSAELDVVYQQLILDHSRTPYGFGLTAESTSRSHQLNPVCGDEVILELHREPGTDIVSAVRWEGHGCAISQASASLLAELVEGLSVPNITTRIDSFRELMRSRGTIEPDAALLGDAVALAGAAQYVSRVKCAMLAWVAAEHAISLLPPV